jgi:hypothetical protein
MYRPRDGFARRAGELRHPTRLAAKRRDEHRRNIAARAERPYLWAMLRFFARFIGLWLLAGGLVAAVVDGAKSIAASGITLTPLSETYATLAAYGSQTPAAEIAIPTAPWPFGLPLAWLMASPTAAVLGILGAALLILGARRRRPFLSREFAA